LKINKVVLSDAKNEKITLIGILNLNKMDKKVLIKKFQNSDNKLFNKNKVKLN
jgi:hypothetical protein